MPSLAKSTLRIPWWIRTASLENNCKMIYLIFSSKEALASVEMDLGGGGGGRGRRTNAHKYLFLINVLIVYLARKKPAKETDFPESSNESFEDHPLQS